MLQKAFQDTPFLPTTDEMDVFERLVPIEPMFTESTLKMKMILSFMSDNLGFRKKMKSPAELESFFEQEDAENQNVWTCKLVS